MNFNRTSLTKMGKFIADLRKKKEYTQKQLAELLDVSDKTVSKWEQCILAPDVTILKPLAQALDTNIDSIVNGENHQSIFRYNIERKRSKFMIIFSILCIFIAAVSFCCGRKGSYEFYKLKSYGVFTVDGYIINFDNESIFVIEKLILNDSNISVKDEILKSVSLDIYSNKKLIYTKNFNAGNSFTLQEFLNNSFIIFEDETNNDKSELNLQISFLNLDNVRFSYSIDLK